MLDERHAPDTLFLYCEHDWRAYPWDDLAPETWMPLIGEQSTGGPGQGLLPHPPESLRPLSPQAPPEPVARGAKAGRRRTGRRSQPASGLRDRDENHRRLP